MRITTCLFVLIVFASPIAAAEQFLTAPFSAGGINLQQGWYYHPNVGGGEHKAIDYILGEIDQSPWDPFSVVAAHDGVAEYHTEWNGGLGNYVSISTTIGIVQYETQYAHLESSTLTEGVPTPVTRGQLLGVTGISGAANGVNHLHFVFKIDGISVDPYDVYSNRDDYPENGGTCGTDVYWTSCPPMVFQPLAVTVDLTLTPLAPYFVGETIQAQCVITNMSSEIFPIDALAVTGRHQNGSVWAFPFHSDITLEPGGIYDYTDTRVLGLPGNYTFEVSHRIGTTWYQTPAVDGVTRSLAVSNVSPTQPFAAGLHNGSGDRRVFIYPSRGDGTFQDEEIIADFTGQGEMRAVEVADFDQDGLLDVFVALENRDCYYLHNDGAIVFASQFLTTIAQSIPIGAAVAGDFTSDGYPDVVVLAGNGSGERVYRLENLGPGVTVTDVSPGGAPGHEFGRKRSDAGDIDRDGNLDIVVEYYTNSGNDKIHLLRGDGTGTFERVVLFTSVPNGCGEGGTPAITLGDFNGDRNLDLLIGYDDDCDPGQTWVRAGNGDGTFGPDWIPAFDVGPGSGDCDAYDFNRDGYDDVFTTGGAGGKLYFGAGDFTFVDPPLTLYTLTGTRGYVGTPQTFPIGVTHAGTSIATNLGILAAIAFDIVTTPGVTRATVLEPEWGPPWIEAAAVIEIVTTATFSGDVSLALSYSQHLGGVDPDQVRLYHDSGSGWVLVPVSLDETSGQLHARVSSLSTFAIAADTTVTGVGDLPGRPSQHALHQNYPNPFNPTTTISFDLVQTSDVLLQIYDVSGRLVRTLLSANKPPGNYSIPWDGRDTSGDPMASGVYFYRLKAGSYTNAKKMVLLQ